MRKILFLSTVVAFSSFSLAAESPSSAKKTPEKSNSPTTSLLGDIKGNPKEPTTTEIYADEAFFDSNKNMGIFTGHVKVTDPRFNLQSDKLTVFISKTQPAKAQASPGEQASPSPSPAPGVPGEQVGQGQGLEKAIAEGNVGVVRDRPDPNGGPPTRAVGRSDMATYIAATGDVELRGNPRVQQGENTHVATSPDTVMILNQKGQLTTHGASRTEIRQQPKDDDDKKDTGKKDGDKKGAAGGADSQSKAGGHKDGSKPEKQKSPGT